MRLPIIVAIIVSTMANISIAANYPLEIIQPRSGLTTANRFYKAYPGLVYNVNVAVIGGAYPFTYTINEPATTCNDNGHLITLDAATGEMSWTPQLTDNGCTLSITVTDNESTTASVSWTIAVQTAGFVFVDSSAVDGGDGSISSPFNSLEDWYINKTSTAYQYSFLYWKNGTYTIPALEDGTRLAFTANSHPQVWLNYPGHAPVFDMTTAHIEVYAGGDNWYFDGLTFVNIANPDRQAVSIISGANNITFRNNDFSGTVATVPNDTNMAHLFFGDGGFGVNWAIFGNDIHDSLDTMAIESYQTSKVLVAHNQIYNIRRGNIAEVHGIAPKMGYTRWDIRGNTLWGNDGHSIWLDGYSKSTTAAGESEVRYNNVYNVHADNAFQTNKDATGLPMQNIYIYRNTFVGPVVVRGSNIGFGPWVFSNNVIQNAVAGITCSSCVDTSSIIDSASPNQNLKGTSGLVDALGYLIDELNIGKGWQLGDEIPPIVDTTAPTITVFSMPSTASSTAVNVTTFTATDNTAVTGYCITTVNSSTGCSWSGSAPTTVNGSAGANTFYAWARDAAGNISTASTASTTITLPSISASIKLGAGRINVGSGSVK